MQVNIKKGIVDIFLANVINLVFSVLTNFLLPKYLSFDSYSAIKTYQLYLNYVGVFSLGCADGMYLRYGGQNLESIDMLDLKTSLQSFRLLMLLVNILMLAIALPIHDKVLFGFTYTIFFSNMANYFKSLYQAIGEFDKYGHILNLTTMMMFAINMSLLFIAKSDNYYFYLVGYAMVNFVIWMLLEINSCTALKQAGKVKISLSILVKDTKSGFLLMVGNFSNILLSSMDRWFVKAMMDTTQFAFYSFAVSLEGFLNVAISPITVTLYNYFCNHRNETEVEKVRKYVILFSSIIIAVAYPAKFVVHYFLPKYTGSVQVLFILFATQIFYSVIMGVYVNLYKAEKKQYLYFLRLVFVLAIGAVLNYSFVKIYPYKEAFSYGTLVSGFIWFILCIRDFKRYKISLQEMVFSSLIIVCFIFTGIELNENLGFIIYVVFWLTLARTLLWDETKSLTQYLLESIKDR